MQTLQDLYFETMRAEAQDDYVRTLGNDYNSQSVQATLDFFAEKIGFEFENRAEFLEAWLIERSSCSEEEIDQIVAYFA